MPPAALELTTPASDRQQTQALDCVATLTGYFKTQQQFPGGTKVNNGKIYETMRQRAKVGAKLTERNDFKVWLFLRIMCRLSRNSGSLNLLQPQEPVSRPVLGEFFFLTHN